MTTKIKNILSLYAFVLSLFLFIASTTIDTKEMSPANCYHCGSVTACKDGNQPYGWDGCVYDPQAQGAAKCTVTGTSGCGIPV